MGATTADKLRECMSGGNRTPAILLGGVLDAKTEDEKRTRTSLREQDPGLPLEKGKVTFEGGARRQKTCHWERLYKKKIFQNIITPSN